MQTLDAEVRYHGVLRVEVEAMASVDLPYHRRIAVPLLLAVDLRKLSGRVRERHRGIHQESSRRSTRPLFVVPYAYAS